MKRIDRRGQILALAATVIAGAVAAAGGGMLYLVEAALNGTLRIPMGSMLGGYPVTWPAVLLIYAAGGVVGLLALSHPRAGSVAMGVVGLCGILLGGPVAKIYGVIMLIAAALCWRSGTPSSGGSESAQKSL